MAISGQQVASSSTLETLRTQFNNLVTDVAAIEGGSISYTTLNTTTTNATTLNVKEDGTIVFEGATDDGFETTLTVVDPTADRTVTFPNASGTVIVSDSSTNVTTLPDDLLIKDGGTIGNASVADVLTLASTGIVTFKDDIIIKDGGTIGSASDTDAITIAANGNITVNQNLSVGGNLDVTGTLDLSDSDFTNVGSIQLDSIAGDGDTNTSITFSGSDVITIATGGSTAATFNASQVTTLSGNLVIPDAGNIGSASDTDAIAIGSDGDVTLTQDLELQHDGAILSFGANDEITLTHVHDTGLLLADSGGTPTLQFHDSNEAVLSDGSNLKLTSGGTTFTIPSSDGSNGQFLKTNGSGVLSFDTVSSAADDLTAGDAAVTLTTTSGNITVDAQGNDTDIIFKGTDGSSDTTFLTIDGSDAGTLIANHDLELGTDGSIIKFGTDNEITLTHVADTGLLLEDSGGSPTLQFHDSNESVSSDGSKLILTSNGTAFSLPTSDGTNGQALITDGSGTFSFTTVSANTPSSADGQALGSASLEWSDLFLADGGTIQFGNDQEIRFTHVADTGLTLSHTASGDDKPIVLNLKSEEDVLVADEEIGRIDFTAGDSDGTDAILTAASIAAVAEDTFAADNNSTGLAFKLGVSAAATEMFRMDHDGDFKIKTDGSAIGFGADNEIELTHVHNTGLLLTDSGGTPTLQLHDSNESIASDGSKVIITSGGTAFSLPTSDGSNGQFLKTNGSAVLSFDDAGSTAFNAFEYTATAGQTSFSGSDDNSASLSYTAGVNNVQVYVNGILLDSSDYTATNGTAVVLSTGAHVSDMIKINAVQVTNVASADLDGAEFVLDADGDTSLRANTDDQIDIKIANAIDFRMTANNFNVLSGSTLTIDSGATITNSGTANGFGLSTGKAIVLAMLFGK